MEKIIVPCPKKVRTDLCGLIRVSPEAESILRRMCRETGVPISRIASAIIEQAADYVEFVRPDHIE